MDRPSEQVPPDKILDLASYLRGSSDNESYGMDVRDGKAGRSTSAVRASKPLPVKLSVTTVLFPVVKWC